MEKYADIPNEFTCDEDFDEFILDSLQYGTDDILGLVAVFYQNLWTKADLRERLKKYEDLEEQGKLLKLPCALGDTVYATFGGKVSKQIVRGILFRENKIWAQDGNGSILGEFGEDVFFTWEEAEAALKEL